MLHYPLGDMCMNCTKLYDKCNHLDFSKMRKHQVDSLAGEVVVICSEYTKKEAGNANSPQ